MKRVLIFLLALVVQADILYSQSNWIDDVDYIPIHAGALYLFKDADSGFAIIKMKAAGIDIVQTEAVPDHMNYFSNSPLNFKMILTEAQDGSEYVDYINYYTSSRYTVWEAEGTPPEISEAMLEYKDEYMHEDISGTYITLNDTVASENGIELIYGPYFEHLIHTKNPRREYPWGDPSYDTTNYRADFYLMLENNGSFKEIADDTSICKIQVTQSTMAWDTTVGNFVLNCTHVIDEITLTRNQFILNEFQEFQLNYRLTDPECSPVTSYEGLDTKAYVQYKVIWLGVENYLLSIDKVVVSDTAGRELKDNTINNIARDSIEYQLSKATTHNSSVIGWVGADEPRTIDQFEPMRIVNGILNDYSGNRRPVWYPLVGAWDGVWNCTCDPFGTYHLSIWKELKKRVGVMNVWQDGYYMDWPYINNYPPSETNPRGCGCSDFRVKNIDLLLNSYKGVIESFPNFGVSIQCGQINNLAAFQRNINSSEFLYETNLALLYGAKFISLYTYFAQEEVDKPNPTGTVHAIVDFDKPYENAPVNEWEFIYTDKYYTLKDTISLRLKGLFGKTLKKLNPVSQYAGSDGINYDGTSQWKLGTTGYSYIEDIVPTGVPSSDIEYGLDMGFFNDSIGTSQKYFMILNRYYSQISRYTIKLQQLSGYYNWNLTNTVDSTSMTLIASNNKSSFPDTLLKGDANLYSLAPVVQYGGELSVNDTIKTNELLFSNMSIKNGATLVINNNNIYTISDTVNLLGTGFITGNGYITLDSGSTININSWSRSLFKSKNGNNPKLFWGDYPSESPNYYKVYRRLNSGSWNLLVQVDSTVNTFTDTSFNITSNNSIVQAEYFIKAIIDSVETDSSNIVDYRTGNYFSVTTPIVANWQTLSVPVMVPNYAKTTVWPTSNSSAYSSCGSGGYIQRDTLKTEVGYYISFNSTQNINYVGGKVNSFEVPVCAGWNIIGSISPKVPISSNVCLLPAENNFVGLKYIYRNGYIQVDSIIPGMGHWVNVSMSGSIKVNENPIQCDDGFYVDEKKFDHFIVTDSRGKKQDLFIANLSLNPSLSNIDLNMPPPIPEAKFDARFSTGEYIKAVKPDSSATELTIDIATDAYPIILRWELNTENGIGYSINSSALGKSGSNTVTLTDGKLKMYALVSDQSKSQLPTIYSLAQNFPNPFNPTTIIKFDLPKDGNVELIVYDILGRKITQLIDEYKSAGSYEHRFDASDLASGIYLYQLRSGDFVSTKKMMLVK